MDSTVQRIQQLYPGRIPVIVRKSPRSDVPDIDKQKFLVQPELTMGQFIYIIRKRLVLPSHKSLFLFVNGALPTTSTLMSQLYLSYKADDGFLYMSYTGESTFGDGD
jgi:GABA(A) receptor-associated protein